MRRVEPNIFEPEDQGASAANLAEHERTYGPCATFWSMTVARIWIELSDEPDTLFEHSLLRVFLVGALWIALAGLAILVLTVAGLVAYGLVHLFT